MIKKRCLFCLVLMLSLLVCTGAIASQKIKLDKTASVKIADTMNFDRVDKEITYYKDQKLAFALGYRVFDGQTDLKQVASILKKNGYSSVKTETKHSVELCHGKKSANGKTTTMYYFNTNSNHYVMLAFTCDNSSAAKKAMKTAVNSIRVKASSGTPTTEPSDNPSSEPDAGGDLPQAVTLSTGVSAPSFSWTVNSGSVTSTTWGGKNLIIIYGKYYNNKVDDYTTRYMDLIKPYLSRLSKQGVQVLVGIYSAPLDKVASFAKNYPGIVCGSVKEVAYISQDTSGMWQGLWDMGYPSNEVVTFPVVFLRSKANKLRFYSTGTFDNALNVVAGALQMAAGK